MKKLVLACLLCVIFFITTTNVGVVYAYSPEHIEFTYNNKIFEYTLNSNIKTSNIFSIHNEINKYNRFGTKQERQELLSKMLKIGFDKRMALDYIFPNLSNKIDSIAKSIYKKPVDSKLTINKNSENVFKISEEQIGFCLDKNALTTSICDYYLQDKTMCFELPITKIYPETTSATYKRFTNLRADFSTDISSSSADRKHNIKNALNTLNMVEILPNQTFSFNTIVGRRTAENGYRSAKIIVNNEFVDGLGGGVCQVSSTLYNAALLSGLEILEANKHSKQVGYVKYGFDAMVNFGSSDLRFRNNTKEKLIIVTNFSTNFARIRIYGESLNGVTYKLYNNISNIIEPSEDVIVDEKGEYLDKVYYDDEYFYLKRGSKGMEIKTYRETYLNNQLITTELLRHDRFRVQNHVKIVGAKTREESLLFHILPTI